MLLEESPEPGSMEGIESQCVETLDERIIVACMYLGCNYDFECYAWYALLYSHILATSMATDFCASCELAGRRAAELKVDEVGEG